MFRAAMERERSQGGILAGGDFRPVFGRKYNRLPLDAVTWEYPLAIERKSFPASRRGRVRAEPAAEFGPGDA